MNTVEKIDARRTLLGWLQGLSNMYVADINAIPEEKWTATFGGCTRPASALTADAISLMVWTTSTLTGTAAGDESDIMAKLNTECGTRPGAIAKLQSSCEAFTNAVQSASDEKLSETVTAPWGMDTPLYSIAQIAVNHLWYHDGQLNYIHCLLGDNKIHWMD